MPEQYEIRWKDYYKIIGVNPDAEAEVIKAAYWALAKKYHPDRKTPDAERMKDINEAYACLSDPQLKADYDRAYRLRRHKSSAGSAEEPAQTRRRYSTAPEPIINPAHTDIGTLNISEKRTAVFSARNLGAEATDVALEYNPDASWLNVSTSANTLPFDITVEVDTSSLLPNHSYQIQISLILDGVVSTAVLQFKTATATAGQKATCTKPSPGGTSTANQKTSAQLNRVFPWPSWGWQRAALFAAFPMALLLLTQFNSPLVWVGVALIILTCYGGIATGWLRNTSQASPVARYAAGTSIAVTIGAPLLVSAMAALFLALVVAGTALVFFLLFAAFSSKG
jgi:curved DNA-binding protein CbpA